MQGFLDASFSRLPRPPRPPWPGQEAFRPPLRRLDNPRIRQPPGSTTRLSEHVLVYHGPIKVGIVRDGPKALLIDCGHAGMAGVQQIIFTHHHGELCPERFQAQPKWEIPDNILLSGYWLTSQMQPSTLMSAGLVVNPPAQVP